MSQTSKHLSSLSGKDVFAQTLFVVSNVIDDGFYKELLVTIAT